MLLIRDATSSHVPEINTLVFSNVKNQVPSGILSYVLELTSMATGASTSCRIASPKLNDRRMEVSITLTKATPDPTIGQLTMGTPTLPYGLYRYRLAHQPLTPVNTDIDNATIFQYGSALLIDKNGNMAELADAFTEYIDNNTYHAYED